MLKECVLLHDTLPSKKKTKHLEFTEILRIFAADKQ